MHNLVSLRSSEPCANSGGKFAGSTHKLANTGKYVHAVDVALDIDATEFNDGARESPTAGALFLPICLGAHGSISGPY